MSQAQRIRDRARSYAYVYLKRGKLTQLSCEVCWKDETEMHHDDYSKPLEVRWLCRDHHLDLHQRAT
jgi:hypothetical protein